LLGSGFRDAESLARKEEPPMQDVKTILAAIDFSPYSSQVLRLAVNLARMLQARFVVVNVINRRDVDAMEMVQRTYPGLTVSKFIQDATAERLQLIEKMLLEEGAESLDVKKRVTVGVPFKEILKAAAEEKADLLVMGSKGRGNLADALFGSTAEKVFRRCPIPLVSVRPKRHIQDEASG
jgi:nucleotide-binding universal stress UspA family protein